MHAKQLIIAIYLKSTEMREKREEMKKKKYDKMRFIVKKKY